MSSIADHDKRPAEIPEDLGRKVFRDTMREYGEDDKRNQRLRNGHINLLMTRSHIARMGCLNSLLSQRSPCPSVLPSMIHGSP